MSVDQTLIQGLMAATEALINRTLQYDPSSRQKIAQIHDVLGVELQQPAMTIYLVGQQDGIRILSYCEQAVATQLYGSITDFIQLLKAPENFTASNIKLSGSTALLQQWQGVLQQLEIDWEDAISTILGDVAGPLAAKGLYQSSRWAQQQGDEHKRLLKEYLSEELKVIPTKPEAEQFFHDNGLFKMDVERLGARIKKLQKTLLKNDLT